MSEGHHKISKCSSFKKAPPTFLVITPNWTLQRWHSSASTQSGAWTKQTNMSYQHRFSGSSESLEVYVQSFSLLVQGPTHADSETYFTHFITITLLQWNKKDKISHSLSCKHGIALLKFREHMTYEKRRTGLLIYNKVLVACKQKMFK